MDQQQPPQTPPATLEQVIDLRNRLVNNEPVTDEELKAGIAFLRQGRIAASQGTATARKKSVAVPVDLSKIL